MVIVIAGLVAFGFLAVWAWGVISATFTNLNARWNR